MGVSLGELIRKSLEIVLATPHAMKTKGGKTRDVLFADTAVYKGDTASNVSKNHDDDLYGDDS